MMVAYVRAFMDDLRTEVPYIREKGKNAQRDQNPHFANFY